MLSMPIGLLREATILTVCAFLLAACGTTSEAPVESRDTSGSAASLSSEGVEFFGTKGVEVTITNVTDKSWSGVKFDLVVKDRNSGDKVTIPFRDTRTFRGERSVADDLEVTLTGGRGASQMEAELDFSNPSVGCPNVTAGTEVGSDNEWLCSEGDSHQFTLGSAAVGAWDIVVKRESDSDRYKRFAVTVEWEQLA